MSIGNYLKRSDLPNLMQVGLRDISGVKYDQVPSFVDGLFHILSSDKAQETFLHVHDISYLQHKPELSLTQQDKPGEVGTVTIVNRAYALEMLVSHEAIADNQYGAAIKMRGESLGKAARETENLRGAEVFNNGFTASAPYLGYDGVEFFATTHSSLVGNMSNELSTPMDLSEEALEQFIKDINLAEDHAGMPISLEPDGLLFHSDQIPEAYRLLRGQERPGTTDRDINFMNMAGLFQNFRGSRFFADTDALFVPTRGVPKEKGLIFIRREALDIQTEMDISRRGVKVNGYTRNGSGFVEWRAAWGTPGA